MLGPTGGETTDPHGRQPIIANKSIVVAGAGIGGLAFAIALAKQWPSAFSKAKLTVYERHSYEESVGREGYTLSLRSDNRSGGVQVLDKLDLYEKVLDASVKGAGEDPGSFFIWDKDWNE